MTFNRETRGSIFFQADLLNNALLPLTQSDQIWPDNTSGRDVFVRGQRRPYHRGSGPSAPNFGVLFNLRIHPPEFFVSSAVELFFFIAR